MGNFFKVALHLPSCRFHRLLFASVRGLEMPPTSLLAYFPPSAPAMVFQLDVNTGEFLPVQIALSEKVPPSLNPQPYTLNLKP